jgi:hypothetical protein
MNDYGDIFLDGKPYRVNLATYQAKDIIDFAPRASVPNGSVFMSDLSLYQPLVQTDWRHGFGFHWYTDGSGYMRTVGNIDTRQDGLVSLMTQAISSDTHNAVKYGLRVFNGSLWSWGPSGLRKYNGSTWSSIYGSPTYNYLLSAGDYLFLCPDGARIQKMNLSEVVSNAGVDANSTDYKWLIIHNGYIYAGKDGTNQVYYDSNADLSQLEGTTSDPGIIYCGIGNVPTIGAIVYAGQLYVARQDGLWLIGEDKIARNVLDYSDSVSSTNFRTMVVINGLLVFSIRDRVVQWNGARVADITPFKLTDEFPYVTYGRYDNFTVSDNFLYATARTNEDTYDEDLICWDGTGWHKLMTLVENSGTDSVTMLTYEPLFNRLWYHVDKTSDATYYIQLQTGSSFPYANFPVGGTNSLISSRQDAGFRYVQKSAPSLFVEARNVTADRYISVYYSIDGEDWVLWSNITSPGITQLDNPGGSRTVEFNYIILRFDFVSDDSAETPILESYTLRFIMRPDVRWGYSFDIICASETEYEHMQDDRTASELKDDIRTARDSKSPIQFIGLLGETVYGYITSVKEQPVYRTLTTNEGTDYIEYILSCNFVEML